MLTFKIFLKHLTIFSLLILAIAGFAIYVLQWFEFKPYMFWVFVFFNAFTIGMHYFLVKSTEGRPQRFIHAFMLVTTAKLFLFLAIIITYALFNRENALGFIITFVAGYFFYTVFEIVSLLKALRK